MQRRTLVTLSALSCVAGLPAWAQDAKTLHFSTLLDVDPATNISEQVVTETYRRIGIAVVVNKLPGERSLRSANSGTDGELYRQLGMDRDYPNLVIVPVPLLTYEIVIFTLGTDFVVHGWESLRPFTVGYVKTIKIVEQNTQGMHIEVAASMRQAILKNAVAPAGDVSGVSLPE